MSASEIINQIKALPPTEQSEVLEFVRQLAAHSDGEERAGKSVRNFSDEQVAAVAEQVFDRHDELFRKLAK